ncbi:hypothetical protein NL676_014692 [Syzygium grande]|nr:hypothetical protein NL676_014692 [Syzygium grande]
MTGDGGSGGMARTTMSIGQRRVSGGHLLGEQAALAHARRQGRGQERGARAVMVAQLGGVSWMNGGARRMANGGRQQAITRRRLRAGQQPDERRWLRTAMAAGPGRGQHSCAAQADRRRAVARLSWGGAEMVVARR